MLQPRRHACSRRGAGASLLFQRHAAATAISTLQSACLLPLLLLAALAIGGVDAFHRTGRVTTLAGPNTAALAQSSGYSDGTGSSVRFNSPQGLAVCNLTGWI